VAYDSCRKKVRCISECVHWLCHTTLDWQSIYWVISAVLLNSTRSFVGLGAPCRLLYFHSCVSCPCKLCDILSSLSNQVWKSPTGVLSVNWSLRLLNAENSQVGYGCNSLRTSARGDLTLSEYAVPSGGSRWWLSLTLHDRILRWWHVACTKLEKNHSINRCQLLHPEVL
jgi:hypothetical protein